MDIEDLLIKSSYKYGQTSEEVKEDLYFLELTSARYFSNLNSEGNQILTDRAKNGEYACGYMAPILKPAYE